MMRAEAATSTLERASRSGTSLIQRLFNLLRWIQREIKRNREEAATIAIMTSGAEGRKQLRSSISRIMLALQPTFAGVIMVLILGSLARFDSRCYEVVSSFIWFTLQVSVFWIPLHDTTGHALMCHSKTRMFYMQLILASIPLLLTLPILFAHLGSWTGYAIGIEATQLAVEALSIPLIYILIPLSLFYFRYQTAKDVKKVVTRSMVGIKRMQSKLQDQTRHGPCSPTAPQVRRFEKGGNEREAAGGDG